MFWKLFNAKNNTRFNTNYAFYNNQSQYLVFVLSMNTICCVYEWMYFLLRRRTLYPTEVHGQALISYSFCRRLSNDFVESGKVERICMSKGMLGRPAQAELCMVFRLRHIPIHETRHTHSAVVVLRFARSTAQTSARIACSFLYSFRHMRKRKPTTYGISSAAHTNS